MQDAATQSSSVSMGLSKSTDGVTIIQLTSRNCHTLQHIATQGSNVRMFLSKGTKSVTIIQATRLRVYSSK